LKGTHLRLDPKKTLVDLVEHLAGGVSIVYAETDEAPPNADQNERVTELAAEDTESPPRLHSDE
jgi:hypothetical protein